MTTPAQTIPIFRIVDTDPRVRVAEITIWIKRVIEVPRILLAKFLRMPGIENRRETVSTRRPNHTHAIGTGR